jgi:O-antigen/teichoic acid export membrane protein
MSGKYKRLASSAILVFVGNIGRKLVRFFMLLFYKKWFSVSEYGATDIVTIHKFHIKHCDMLYC